MITVRPLLQLDDSDLSRIVSPYESNGVYDVSYRDSITGTSFELHYRPLPTPAVRTYSHFDAATIERYTQILNAGFSFGAYAGELLVGMLIAEPETWNQSLLVREFHVAASHRRCGIGRQLISEVEASARQAGLRTIVCETQNTNAAAIQIYRKLGFAIEGVDISFYSNRDYPDGDIAVFMKRRIV